MSRSKILPDPKLSARTKRAVLAGADAAAWGGAVVAVDELRYSLLGSSPDVGGLLGAAGLVMAAQLIAGFGLGLYRGRHRVGSFEEALGLGESMLGVAAALVIFDLAGARPIPLSVAVFAGPLALVIEMCFRSAIRSELARRRRPSGDRATRLIVFGGGEGGADAIRTMLRDRSGPYLPVAVLDDDPHKRHLSLTGIKVVGGRAELAKVAADYDASAVLIAIPSAPAELIRDVTDRGRAAGLDVKILPSLREIFDGTARANALRSPTIADLLGRREVRAQLAAASGYLSGKRVLVTGAGGSIGSELSRQIARLSPAELIVVDRDESALHALQMSISGRALLDSPDVVVVDIRDRRAVRDLFQQRRPQVVFHAAALKHLPALEMYPGEAIKTNVWATMHVLEAAATTGVERFVNVSTDKAANPTSALGYSKRIGERLTAAVAQQAAGTFVSVRFGNVLGSRGSVLGAFQDQIAKGGPVTVTHPEVSRYFMTVEEACGLVIQAGAIGRPGEALVLDMGAPVRIADVARRLIAEAGKPVEIVYTGLRPGEKLHENLFGDGEPDERPLHPLVSHVTVPPLHPGRLRSLDAYSTSGEMIQAMAYLASAPGIRAGENGPIDLRSVTADPAWTHALVAAQGHDPLPLEEDSPAGCRRHRRRNDSCGHGVPVCDSEQLIVDLPG